MWVEFSLQNMWTSNISYKLLILVLLTLSKIKAESSAYERKDKHFAALDLAKDAISKAKDLQPTCVSDSKDISSNSCEYSGKEKVSAYLDFGLNLIENAKENYLTCDESKNISKIGVQNKPIDCTEILENGENKSGEYVIWPRNPQIGNLQLKVFCDMDTDGGGWTVIQRRGSFSNKIDFYRNWRDYKQGFGNLSEEFWIGNDNIFALTHQGRYSLRFDLENVNKEYRYETYTSFRIEDEKARYRVYFDTFSGTAGHGIHTMRNTVFTTKDKDNGKSTTSTPCTSYKRGGWWYDNCGYSNPNGINLPGVKASKDERKYMNWHPWTGYDSLLTIEMKIRSEI